MKVIKDKIALLGSVKILDSFAKYQDKNFDIDGYLQSENINLPIEYLFFAKEYGFHQFKLDVLFKSIDKLPITDNDNLCPVDFIYGWGTGSNSLQEIRETFKEQIPSNYFVFAEGNAGDQLCIDQNNQKIYYWHHESMETKDVFLVSDSFLLFISSLQIAENEEPNSSEDDLEEEWFSDDF